jgi:hypothetical protein
MHPSIPEMIDKYERSTWFEWYYRIFAPPVAPSEASLLVRELSRRGRLSSIVLFLGLFMAAMALPIAFGPDKELLPVLLLSIILIACSIWINKKGHTTTAGILCVLCSEACLLSAIGTTPTGLTLFALSLFDVLIIPEVIAVSLLVPWSVFIVAALNSIAFICFFIFLHHDAALNAVIKSQGYDILLRPIAIQFVVAIVTCLWVRSANRAIKKADRAEVIALLQSDLLIMQSENQRRQQELNRVIAVLEDAQNRIARGDLSVRVPLEGEILASIGGKFNNLINRFQRALKSENDLLYLQQTINYIVDEVDIARKRGGPFQLRRTGTRLDGLLLAFLVLQQNQETSRNPITTHSQKPITTSNTKPIAYNPSSHDPGGYNPGTPFPPIPATNQRTEEQANHQNRSSTSVFRSRSLYLPPSQIDT